MPDLDNLPPTQYLILEVLAARHRLGEAHWTFPVRVAASLRDLQAVGLISVMHGITEHTLRASLTDAGRERALGKSYVSPVDEAARSRELYAEIASLRQALEANRPEGWESVAALQEAYAALLAELERSEAACASAMAEVEALTTERDHAREEWHRHNVRADEWRHRASRAETEVERLRDAIKHVADLYVHGNTAGLIAAAAGLRKVLEGGT